MPRRWRALAAVTLTAGALMSLQLPAAASSAKSTVTVTIAAKSRFPLVTGDVLVVFRSARFGQATIHGSITGAVSADVATLFAQPFPFKHKPVRTGKPIRLTGASQTYSFKVRPAIATRYLVKVSTAGPSGTQVGASAVQTVYLTSNGHVTGARVCGRPTCREKLRIYTVVPASAVRRERPKHLYFYFGINLNRRKTPPAPKNLHLRIRHTVTRARRISATEWERTIAWSFFVGDDGYNWLFAVCARDTESKDGVGLPGHHGCGAKTISSRSVYLG
jgi:hypothetical protein